MRKWKYRFYNRRNAPWHEILEELNELGAEGWELISSDVEIEERKNENVLYYHCVLKREASD